MEREVMESSKTPSGYCLTGIALSEQSIVKILESLSNRSLNTQPVLGGRLGIRVLALEGIGDVAIKEYARGGFWGLIVRGFYLRIGATRSELEFKALTHARSIGINVPEPILAISQGAICYRAWLVTKFIPGLRSVAEVALANEDVAYDLMPLVAVQIEKLIRNKIHHIDLHPGNILFDENNIPYILDFDRATSFNGECAALRDLYINRWRRAVIKHNLPDSLSEAFSHKLLEVDFAKH